MGKVITVMNMKGGVGKTTVSLHLGGVLGRCAIDGKRRKVLLLDYDPQFNLSQAFIAAPKYFELEAARKTSLAILQDDATKLDPFVIQMPETAVPPSVSSLSLSLYKDGEGGLDIVPSTLDLMYLATGQANVKMAPIEVRFDSFIAEARGLYDLIIIDCHPAGSVFTKTSLTNSDHVLIPVVPSKFAARGIQLMVDFVKRSKLPNSLGPVPHILFNKTHRNGIRDSSEISIRANRRFAPYCLNQSMHSYGAFSEPHEGLGFVWHSGKAYSTEAYGNAIGVATECVRRFAA